MKGARPLSNDEILLVAEQFSGTYATRNRSLFMLGVSVGGRISELLQLTIGDVYQNGQPVKDLLFQKDVVKGKENARMVPVNADGRKAIALLIDWHQQQYGSLDTERPLFTSRKGGGMAAMTRGQAHKVLEAAFTQAGLNGKLATHSLRKSFAQRIYDGTGDIYLVQELLGHQSIETTKKYLGISYQKLQRAVEMIEVERHRRPLLYHSPDDLPDDTILIQALKRGLIDPQAIMPKPDEQKRATGKVIPISQARGTHQVGSGGVWKQGG